MKKSNISFKTETQKVKPFIEKYCIGKGLDIGCGVEKVVPSAIGIDYQTQYNIEDHPQTDADYKNGWEEFFEQTKEEYDYIYSSHLIEDYTHPYDIITEWIKYLKNDGFLILVLPIENLYRKLGENINLRHSNNWESALDFYKQMSAELKSKLELIDYSKEPIVDYNFYIVFKKKTFSIDENNSTVNTATHNLTVSIAIHNPDIKIFKRMLCSLKKYTPELEQIIIVDNASENIKEWSKIFDSIFGGQGEIICTFIPLVENLGLGKAHNKALKRAIGKYFAILNDDIEFFDIWSTQMIAMLDSDPQIGQTVPKEGVCNTWTKEGIGYGIQTDEPEYAECSCMMTRTEIVKKEGLFSDDYEMGYCEDGDLSLRLRKVGYTIKNVDIKWKHHRAVTSKKIKDMDGYEANNRITFRNKWMPYLISKDITKDTVIVVKRTASIGDVFLTLPIMEALKKKYPTSIIILQTNTPQAVLYDKNIDVITEVGNIIPHDIFINLDDAYEETPWIPWVECYAKKAKVKINKKYRHISLLSKDIRDIDNIIPSHFGRFVVLDLSTTWPSKQWDQGNYKKITRKIREAGYKVVLAGINSELIKIDYDLNFINTLDILQTGALLRRAHIYVGHEGLIAHIANSMNIPSVILYGCTTPEVCNDLSTGNVIPVIAPIPCQGCRNRFKGCGIDCSINFRCMKEITVDMVWDVCEGLIKEMEGSNCISSQV